jgi:hypothetical protein
MSVFRFVLLIITLSSYVQKLQAQNAPKHEDQKEWVKHMLQSDTRKLLNFMSPMVDVDLPTQRGAFNQSQLQNVLNNFFRQHPPTSITIEQQGALNPRNDYFIGTYTSGEMEYRLYIQAEKQTEGHKIFSFSIQRK